MNTNYLVLVNKENKLPDNWLDTIELTCAKDIWGEDMKIEKETRTQFRKLREKLFKDKIYLLLDSAHREIFEQEYIWNKFEEEFGLEYTKRYVAVPGYSEHHTGLAIDVCFIYDGHIISENPELAESKGVFEVIHKNLADFGFILRYPQGKEEVTGYGYEPWHLRYVGSVEIAKYIYANNLTLEEYLKM